MKNFCKDHVITLSIRRVVGRFMLVSCLAICVSTVSAYGESEEPYDPIEPVNRAIFDFNDTVDVYVLEPVARGYRDNVPETVQTGIGNFFENLRYPSYLVSDIFQGKFEQALDHTGRFLINTTLGIGGLMDFATEWGLPVHDEDFGITLAYHGVPAGPYLVLPILGPSNVRDGVGRIVDGFLDPIGWVGYSSLSAGTKVAIVAGSLGVKLVHTRAGLLQAVETAKESSVDYYLFVQGAYYQHRHGVLTDGKDEDELDGADTEVSDQ
jgi:phospholipid-binding lipoprotein MlaA